MGDEGASEEFIGIREVIGREEDAGIVFWSIDFLSGLWRKGLRY